MQTSSPSAPDRPVPQHGGNWTLRVRLAVVAPPVALVGLVAKWPLAEYGCLALAAVLGIGAVLTRNPPTHSDRILSPVADIADIGPAQVGVPALTPLPPARCAIAAIADSPQHGE